MRRQKHPLRRRPPKLDARPRLLIVCEGEVTEPSYFAGLRIEEQIRGVDIEIDRSGGDPKTLVERAVSRSKSAKRKARAAADTNLEYDEIWCVFDVDEHPKLLEAKQQAAAHKIPLAVSNPCFELWLLLHFQEQRAWIHRDDAQRVCRQCLKHFEKKRVDFKELKDRIEDAIQRATILEKWQAERQQSGENPSTTVHRLIQRLKDLSKASTLEKIRALQE